MRLALSVLAIGFLAAGCGQADREPPEAADGPPETIEQPKTESEPPDGAITPPKILLASEAGRQVGVRGAFCVTSVEAGQGLCVDTTRPEATEASVVRPGETMAIVLDGARAIKDQGCHARDMSCIGEARVSSAGCKAVTVARIFLERGPETEWRVSLPPGAYELEVFVYFEADDGSTGDVSVALGLVVDPDGEPAIIPMPAAAAVCP